MDIKRENDLPDTPLHQEDGKWYFWDETWSDRYGPFDTEEKAKEELAKYAVYLDNILHNEIYKYN